MRATLPPLTCAGCGKKPVLRSRTDLQDYLLGSAPSHCLRCDKGAAYDVERELDPNAQQRRERRRQRGQAQTAERHARERWEARQRAQIEAAYPLRLDPGGAAQDVLRIHPGSPARAWAWQESFQQAGAAAGDPDSVSEPQRGDVDLLLVHWYTPFGDAGPVATDELYGHPIARLQPDQMHGSRRRELLDFCLELVQHEAIHDFEVRLEQAGLPRLGASQRERLTQVMGTLTEYLTLAQCSTLSSRALRGAFTEYRRTRRSCRPHRRSRRCGLKPGRRTAAGCANENMFAPTGGGAWFITPPCSIT